MTHDEKRKIYLRIETVGSPGGSKLDIQHNNAEAYHRQAALRHAGEGALDVAAHIKMKIVEARQSERLSTAALKIQPMQ